MTMTKENAIQAFVKLYFDTEASVFNKDTGIAKFEEHHKATFAAQIRHLKTEFGVRRRHLVMALAAADTKDAKTDRHEWRLTQWVKQNPEPAAVVAKVAAKPAAKTAATKPAAKSSTVGAAPVTISTESGEMRLFMNNLGQSIKSVCKSAFKNNLTAAQVQNLLGQSLKEAGEEFKVEQNAMKFTAFMAQNNIDKYTALDILQNM